MKRTILIIGLAIALFLGCSPSHGETASEVAKGTSIDVKTPYADVKPTAEQEAEIKSLIEQLVLSDRQAANRPTINPNMKIYDAEGKKVKPRGDEKKAEEYRKRFNSCGEAFQKLSRGRSSPSRRWSPIWTTSGNRSTSETTMWRIRSEMRVIGTFTTNSWTDRRTIRNMARAAWDATASIM